MKKIFIFLFIFFLAFISFKSDSFAQTIPLQRQVMPTNDDFQVTTVTSDYQLPYPGLLPDNPLYKLKVIRDKIVEFLISDPLKKAEFDLLQSDKRLNGAYYLFKADPSKSALVVETISKGENYVANGISELHLAKKQGMDINDMRQRFFLSNKKHLEVIQIIENTISTKVKNNLDHEEERVKEFDKIVNHNMPFN